MTVRFSGVIAIEGVQTGDGRLMAEGSLTWADLPLPLSWLQVEMHSMPGDGIQIGIIDQISRGENGEITASGLIDDEIPEGAEVVRRLRAGTAPFGSEWGISIDADDFEVELVAPEGLAEDEGTEVVLMASAVRQGGHGVFRQGRMTAHLTITAAAGDADDGGELLMEASADEVIERATRLRIRGATLCAIPAFDGARISLAMDPDENEPDIVDEEDDQETEDNAPDEEMTVTASVFAQGMIVTHDGEPILASGYPITPPVSWFDDPGFDQPHPLTVDENGRVFGHIATFNRCHVGMSGCTLAPKSGRAYDLFLTGEMRCAEGCSVRVGTLTTNIPHAPASLDASATAAHYDDTRAAAAYVACGEDEFGIWVAGTVRPDLSDAQLVNLRASKPSGDWRPMNGAHELVAVLMVNTPGFPIERPIAASAVPQEVLDMAVERIDKRFLSHLDQKVARSAASND